MPDHTTEEKTLPRLSMQVILKKIKEVTRIRPEPPRKVAVERIYFGDSGPGGGYYDFNDAGESKATSETNVAVGEIVTITGVAICDAANAHSIRLQYSALGSTNPIVIGYGSPSKTGGELHILEIYRDIGDFKLKARVYNSGPVDVKARMFYQRCIT